MISHARNSWTRGIKLFLDFCSWRHISHCGRQNLIVYSVVIHTRVHVRKFGGCQTCLIIGSLCSWACKLDIARSIHLQEMSISPAVKPSQKRDRLHALLVASTSTVVRHQDPTLCAHTFLFFLSKTPNFRFLDQTSNLLVKLKLLWRCDRDSWKLLLNYSYKIIK